MLKETVCAGLEPFLVACIPIRARSCCGHQSPRELNQNSLSFEKIPFFFLDTVDFGCLVPFCLCRRAHPDQRCQCVYFAVRSVKAAPVGQCIGHKANYSVTTNFDRWRIDLDARLKDSYFTGESRSDLDFGF